MSQLIHLKQRIKAIASIKKITQTMRLISMSAHSKLKKQSDAMQHLKDELKPLLCALNEKNILPQKNEHAPYKTLYILFAAEKGLCGTFNSSMFGYFNQTLTSQALENSHVITVGKKTIQYVEQKNITPIASFDKVLPNQLEAIAEQLYNKILEVQHDYQQIVCLYNYPKTFFLQVPSSTQIMPIQPDPCDTKSQINLDHYDWPQDIKSVTEALFQSLLKINILLILTNSMLSEQSARFLSMDNATRSAENLQKNMKLTFNKMRQAKITRELIELAAGF